MFVKKFEAPSLEQALTAVKTELGPNALILSTTHHKGKLMQRPFVEVTAAFDQRKVEKERKEFVEEELEKLFPHRRSPDEDMLKPRGQKTNRYLDTEIVSPKRPKATSYESEFLKAGFSSESARDLGNRLTYEYPKGDLENPVLLEKIRSKMLCAGLNSLSADVFTARAHWAVVGSSGCGKTSLAVKLALDVKSKGMKVSLLGGDQRKLVGQKELSGYAKLINVGFSAEVQKPKASNVTFLDTPSVSLGTEESDELSRLVTGRSVLYVVDATSRLIEALKTYEKLAEKISISAVAFTKLDCALQRGLLYDFLRQTRAPLLVASLSQSFKVPVKYFETPELASFILKGRGI